MPKSGKIEVVACCEAGSRGTKISCEFCAKSWHIKCANITANALKTLRDTGGACWLCPTCRSPDGRQPASSDTSKLILQRVTSALLLIGNLTDTMRVFCRMYSASLSTPVKTLPAALDPDLSDAFHANLSNLFDSILGDGNKRPRTSSLSRPSEVQPEKILRVDIPVDQTIESNITVPPVSDAAGTFPTATPENLAATLLAAAVLGVSPSASQQLPAAAVAAATAAASPVTPLAISQQLGASQPAGFQQSPTAETAALPPVANPQVAAVAAIPPTIQSGVLPLISPQQVADLSQMDLSSPQPLVSPPPTMLSAQPLVKPQPPPPQIMPSLQPLISPPPPLTLAPPPPLITQPLQTAPLASTSAVTPSFHNELAARSSAVINTNQQSTRPTVNFIPYPTSFTVTEGNHINVYGPSPPLLDQQLTVSSTQNAQTRQTNCMPHCHTPLKPL
ncbi:proline-rich protein 36-like [Culex pipiens pallens]|uniref:proline-rich protein 36-like n=1 Tax=Culex pipiens pallens TaxID=42434 RepID=UPI001953B4F1|nr:proline-rich protein 36-like [Culex pipiens pallens]